VTSPRSAPNDELSQLTKSRATTWIGLAPKGRRALNDHVATLRKIIAMVEQP
jgi:hypothetical protein